jgi:outer membrane protein
VKKLFFILLFFTISVNSFAQMITQKTGYVNSEVIYEQYAPAIKAQSDLEALASKWRASRDSMVAEFQKKFTDYQNKAETMQEAERQLAEQELAGDNQAIQEYEQQKFGQGGDFFIKQAELYKPIRERVLKVIEAVAGEEGYNFVFDKTETTSVLLYGDSDFDITFKVLDRLKKDK